MTEMYTAVGVQSNVYDCKYRIQDKADYSRNLKHLSSMIDVAVQHSMELPVRLIAIPEGAIQGFPDEWHDWDPVAYARDGALISQFGVYSNPVMMSPPPTSSDRPRPACPSFPIVSSIRRS